VSGPDRRAALAAQHAVTGIDFVYVAADQVNLDVVFLTDPFALTTSLVSLTASQIRIHAELLPDVPVIAMAWAVADGRHVLHLVTAAPGGFTPYRLAIADPRIDAFFNDVAFSFQANCPSDFDCEPPPHECPPEPQVDVPIDYTARDFWSLRTALFDFASQRYPDWKDRLEADVGVMLAELWSHLGDEMSYYQDRVAREASFEAASQRRSLRRYARLVDYVIHDGLGATGWIDVQVRDAVPGVQDLPAGVVVWADSSSGILVNGKFIPRRIYFEVGHGLAEVLAGKRYKVAAARNRLTPHLWDETQRCLAVGATELWIDGHHAADLPLDDVPDDAPPGRWVILQTDPLDPSITARRHLVRLIAVTDAVDPLGAALGTSTDITHLVWEPAQALPFELDLALRFTVRGNLVPITAGKTQRAVFSIGPNSGPYPQLTGPALVVPRAVERTGPNASVAFLFSLRAAPRVTVADENVEDPDDTLVWLSGGAGAPGDPRDATPELHVSEIDLPSLAPGDAWQWRRGLLGVDSSEPQDKHITLDDGIWTRVVGYQRLGGEVVHVDYLTGTGMTLRFGDGEFGRTPPRGTGFAPDDSLFEVIWRVGNGTRSNVPDAAITRWRGLDANDLTDPPLASDPPLGFLASISNPLATAGGLDPESATEIKQLAPDAFRQITYRAVRPEDYAEAAERLPWVQRAGGAFRWTGSWLTALVTADPFGAPALTAARRDELEVWLDRFRQAGREVHVQAPRYADVDLAVRICVEPSSYRGDVEQAVLIALFGKRGVRPVVGFFDPDSFTFGTPLDRSALEAAIQRVAGVRAVEYLAIRRRGWFSWRVFSNLAYTPAPDEVIRLDNDPLHPERGTLRLVAEGGA
jgi:hypothetical protein